MVFLITVSINCNLLPPLTQPPPEQVSDSADLIPEYNEALSPHGAVSLNLGYRRIISKPYPYVQTGQEHHCLIAVVLHRLGARQNQR